MKHNELVIRCHHHILFQIIGTLGKGQYLGFKCMFRQVAAGTTMGNHHFVLGKYQRCAEAKQQSKGQ